jgi:hypothetical protein
MRISPLGTICYDVGDRVRIKRKDIFHLAHRKNRNGVITAIDGSYHFVRPMWCRWEIELYPNEIEPVAK